MSLERTLKAHPYVAIVQAQDLSLLAVTLMMLGTSNWGDSRAVTRWRKNRGRSVLGFLIALVGLWLFFPKTAASNPYAVISGVVLLFVLVAGSCAG